MLLRRGVPAEDRGAHATAHGDQKDRRRHPYRLAPAHPSHADIPRSANAPHRVASGPPGFLNRSTGRRHGQSTPWFAPKETPAASAAGWFLRVVPQTGAEPPAKVEKLLALFRRDAVGGSPGPKHRRPSDPDQRGIGVGNGELVHAPGFDFGMGLADDLILEGDRQFIDIGAVIVKCE